MFRKGTLNYFECKAIHGNTLNFKSHIRENQWDKLLEKNKIPMVNAGIICWFIDWDKTVFLDIYWLNYLKEQRYKSFNIQKDCDKIPVYYIPGKKKKIFYEYDLFDLLYNISYTGIEDLEDIYEN